MLCDAPAPPSARASRRASRRGGAGPRAPAPPPRATSSSVAAPGSAEEAAAFAAAAAGGANLVPLFVRIFSDHLTPVLAYRCLVKQDEREAPSFLLESVVNGNQSVRAPPRAA